MNRAEIFLANHEWHRVQQIAAVENRGVSSVLRDLVHIGLRARRDLLLSGSPVPAASKPTGEPGPTSDGGRA